MKKYIVIIGSLVILIFIFLTGCSDQGTNQTNTTESLLGTWKDRDSWYGSYIFNANGTCVINNNLIGTYEVSNETLLITYPNNEKFTFEYHLSSYQTTLILTNIVNGDIRVYEKQ